ncbi:MAG: addiction module protein [Candidatus Binatia bacterium]|nr:addiction module protein [Candidatus Binatia bacterium]
MADPLRKLQDDALKLPVRARARLAETLIASLDEEPDVAADRLWLEEAERRLDELDSAKVGSVPAADVFEKASQATR